MTNDIVINRLKALNLQFSPTVASNGAASIKAHSIPQSGENDLKEERSHATFNVREMTFLLEGGEKKTKVFIITII
jgi:hypothetical protein